MSDNSHKSAAKVVGLQKVYQSNGRLVEALRGVDLDIPQGAFVAVMGASGSGKSTLLHLLAGLDVADAGCVEIAGKNVSDLNDRDQTAFRRRHIGIVFQAYNLVPVLTAQENVALPLILDGLADVKALAKAKAALAEVGLSERADHRPDQLSGGEQQRVAIARALIADPALILADEPTGNLDSVGALGITKLLEDLHGQGRTIVLITHDVQLASHAETVHVMADGQLRGVLQRSDFRTAETLSKRYLAILAHEACDA